jgi:hypothetical protein
MVREEGEVTGIVLREQGDPIAKVGAVRIQRVRMVTSYCAGGARDALFQTFKLENAVDALFPYISRAP